MGGLKGETRRNRTEVPGIFVRLKNEKKAKKSTLFGRFGRFTPEGQVANPEPSPPREGNNLSRPKEREQNVFRFNDNDYT